MTEFRVGSVDDFPDGQIRAVEVDDRPIAVLRLGEHYYAFDNFCTHEGVTFTSGYGVVAKNRVVCMLHSSAFDVATGQVLAGPAPDSLQTYQVVIKDDGSVVVVTG